jgi:hypothetical protein
MIISTSLVADVGLRFVPPARMAHRSWEAAFVFPRIGPFAPNMVYDNDRAYGDLPAMANLPSLRVYRREHFTTDAFGFRNTPSAQNRPIRIIVVGDSFAAGAGLSDSETLSAQLARMGQTGVYNGGATYSWSAAERLIRRLQFKGGLVIWQISERFDAPPEVGADVKFEDRVLSSLLPPDSTGYEIMRTAFRLARGFLKYSPLRIVMTRMFSVFEDGRWLPNASAGNVVLAQVGNGRQMGFFSAEFEKFGKKRPTPPDYFVGLQAAVRATGNEMIVLMVPDKLNVYYPLVKGFAQPGEYSTLNVLAQNLRKNGVPALDLTPIFRQQAADALRNGQYLYWLDDTHWSPLGVRIAAGEILKFLRESGIQQRVDLTTEGHSNSPPLNPPPPAKTPSAIGVAPLPRLKTPSNTLVP